MPEGIDTRTAYSRGLALLGMDGEPLAGPPADITSARGYARSHRLALNDHASTSYYGAANLAATSAYWYGVARALRSDTNSFYHSGLHPSVYTRGYGG